MLAGSELVCPHADVRRRPLLDTRMLVSPGNKSKCALPRPSILWLNLHRGAERSAQRAKCFQLSLTRLCAVSIILSSCVSNRPRDGIANLVRASEGSASIIDIINTIISTIISIIIATPLDVSFEAVSSVILCRHAGHCGQGLHAGLGRAGRIDSGAVQRSGGTRRADKNAQTTRAHDAHTPHDATHTHAHTWPKRWGRTRESTAHIPAHVHSTVGLGQTTETYHIYRPQQDEDEQWTEGQTLCTGFWSRGISRWPWLFIKCRCGGWPPSGLPPPAAGRGLASRCEDCCEHSALHLAGTPRRRTPAVVGPSC